MNLDPTTSNPDLYKVIFENDRVRVLEYKDRPGEGTTPHVHPDSVMYALSSFNRRLVSGGREVDVEIQAGSVRWLDAQEHSGLNVGDSGTHVIFVELKEPNPANGSGHSAAPLGPPPHSLGIAFQFDREEAHAFGSPTFGSFLPNDWQSRLARAI